MDAVRNVLLSVSLIVIFLFSFRDGCTICVNIYLPAIWRRSKVIYLKTENNSEWKWPNLTECASAKILSTNKSFANFHHLIASDSPHPAFVSILVLPPPHVSLCVVYSPIWFRQMLTQQKFIQPQCEKLCRVHAVNKRKKNKKNYNKNK